MTVERQRYQGLGSIVEVVGAPPSLQRHMEALLGSPVADVGPVDVRVHVVGADREPARERLIAGPEMDWDGSELRLRQPGGWLKIPAGALSGEPIELTCVEGTRKLPILRPLLFARACASGNLPIHGPAFMIDDLAYVATGWPRSAKTGLLLGVIATGGSAICAEHATLDPATGSMSPGSEPIFARAWHLRQFGSKVPLVPRSARLRVTLLDRALSVAMMLPGPAGRAARFRRDALSVRLTPRAVRYRAVPATVSGVVFLTATTHGSVTIARISASEAAARLAALFEVEVAELAAAESRLGYVGGADGGVSIHALVGRYRARASALAKSIETVELRHGPEPALGDMVAALRSVRPESARV